MANKRPKPEEIVSKLRQVEVLTGQGMPRLDAIRQLGGTSPHVAASGVRIDRGVHYSRSSSSTLRIADAAAQKAGDAEQEARKLRVRLAELRAKLLRSNKLIEDLKRRPSGEIREDFSLARVDDSPLARADGISFGAVKAPAQILEDQPATPAAQALSVSRVPAFVERVVAEPRIRCATVPLSTTCATIGPIPPALPRCPPSLA